MKRAEVVRDYGGISAADRRADRRRKLVAAGRHLWGESGIADVTVRGVCAHAGLIARYFYVQFDGRDALLFAVVDEVRSQLLDAMVIAGVGLGGIAAISNSAALSFAPDEQAGVAGSTFGTFRQVGLAMGIAGLGAIPTLLASGGDVSSTLITDDRIRKISFTGSTPVGKKLIAQAAEGVLRVSMELGGNAPFIVFDDADLDAAVEGALISKYRNNGQTCVCANRLYVQDGVYDRFAEKLQQAVSKLQIGDGLQPNVTIGPLIDEKAIAKVQEHIADALGKGARIVTGGKVHELGGNFFQPTILVDVPGDAKVAKEETFGPLAPLFRFKDEADIIAQANDTEFGLAAYFYARDLSRVFRVGEALEYGIIGINTGLISTEVAPFGGVKSSGLGREGSKYGIEDYLEIKYMCIGI